MTERAFVAGDVVRLTRAASPQFVRPIVVRVARELTDRRKPYGWLWLEGYELDPHRGTGAKRELFVMRAGVDLIAQAPRRADEARIPSPIRPGAD
ncbi:hypothetical protein AB0C15_17030 [Micromonospora sp. NPDC048835]|uniref:hypothetical protein n=1 Tax=Micromonospora sp. NPDC048835 TaxID=3155147 RepID=UPI0033E220E6